MSDYNPNDYLNVTLSNPVELPNGSKVDNVEIIPMSKIHLVDYSSAKVDFNADQFGSFLRLLKSTARDGQSGHPLPDSFFRKLNMGHMEELSLVLSGSEDDVLEIPDPNL